MVAKGGVQVGVVGAGRWGRNLVRNFHQLGALGWICDVRQEVLDELGEAYSGVRLTRRLEEVLADEAVAGIVLATPSASHFQQASAALDRGRHVLVEKPLALRYIDGRELVTQASTKGLVLMVGHILEYHPAVTRLKEIVARGELGRLWYMYSNRLNLGQFRHEENILWSFAPHDLSVIIRLAGREPERVQASGGSYLQTAIADLTVSDLVFDGGLRAHVFVSWLHPYKEQRLVVIGDEKMAVFDDTAGDGKLRVYDKGVDWQEGVPVPRHSGETVVELDATEPLRIECEHFLACIQNGSPPLTDGDSALRVLRVLEASQLSLERGGAPVSMSEIG
ncbi:MAG: Gfo/Idh/MocA family oxidoreductase [Candidatus Neomarinimicrobiota bacterium]